MLNAAGIGSGLDISALVAQLVQAEGEPVSLRLDEREALIQAEISGIGLLSSALSGLGNAIDKLELVTTFNQRSASSSDPATFTATASSGAVPANYSIEVVRLATAHKLASVGFAGATTPVGSGLLTISSGTKAFGITIPATANTLADIRSAINAASEATGVSATLVTVDDGLGGSTTKLLLAASQTGTASVITVTVNDGDGNHTDLNGLSGLGFDPNGSGVTNMSVSQAALNAEIKVDGATVTRGANTITDSIEGVSIELAAVSTAGADTLSVSQDAGVVHAAIEDFVGAYNDLRESIATLTRFDPITGQRGILLGDAGVLGIVTQLQRELGARVDLGGPFSRLSELGIRTQADGTLSLETAVLAAALEGDADAVAQLFTANGGFAPRLDGVVAGLVGADGSLDSRTEGLNRLIDVIGDQRAALDRRLTSLESRLLTQFNAMDVLVAQLRSTSSFLTTQLSAIQALTHRSSGF